MKKPKARLAAVLSQDDKMLVVLRDELYAGSWQKMLLDLKARLVKKPFVFRWAHRVEVDMERIQRLMRIENRNGVNLADVIRAGGRL